MKNNINGCFIASFQEDYSHVKLLDSFIVLFFKANEEDQ